MAAQTTRYDMARASARKSRTKRSGQTHNPNPTAAPPFDLDRFEQLALSRHCGDVEQAFQMLHELLSAMELSRGGIPAGLSTQRPPGGPATPELERLTLLWTRIAHAISGLFLHPAFETMNLEGLQKLLLVQKQLAAIFHASSLESADACILAFDRAAPGQPFTIAQEDLYKVLLLYSLESRLGLELITGFDAADRQAVLFSCIALCSTAFCGTRRSYERREEVLAYLCQQLERHELEEPALYLLTVTVYMYCSYASSTDKHAIKGLIHRQWRQRLLGLGLTDLVERGQAWPSLATRPFQDKPVLLVLHEWLASGSAMHRCYANWIAALRQRFYTVGMGQKQNTNMDDTALALFDTYVTLPEGVPVPQVVKAIRRWCQQHQPAAIYYPSIGMGGHTVAAASIRLAPLQLMTQGHPSTTGGSCIDVLVSAADYACFDGDLILDRSLIEEQLVLVPPGAMTWLTPGWEGGPSRERAERQRSRIANPGLVPQIVISASPMKLGAPFLELCQRIWQRTQGRAYWHFFIAEARGCLHLEIARTIRAYLGEDCRIYPHLEYKDYIKALQVGDIFLTPFPFGNSNTLYDYFAAGLIGANLRSGELSCSVDTCLFHRLGFPNSLIASSPSAYEDIAVRLILDSDWRQQLYHHTYDSNANHQAVFSGGDASKFADTVASLL